MTDPTPASLPRIGVIMPAYNEAERIEETLGTVARYLADGGNVSRVYLADDGSTDRTIEIAEGEAARLDLSLEVLRLPHRGKAWTVRTAMLQVAGSTDLDYLLMLDADNELRIDQLQRIVWADDPRTIYIGRRTQRTADSTDVIPPLVRRLMSRVMRLASSSILGIHFLDTQCGFKLFPRVIAADLFGQQRSTSWTFDAELLLIASISRIPVIEVEVTWSPRGSSRIGLAAGISSGVGLLWTALNRVRGVYRPIGRADLPSADPSSPAGSTQHRRADS